MPPSCNSVPIWWFCLHLISGSTQKLLHYALNILPHIFQYCVLSLVKLTGFTSNRLAISHVTIKTNRPAGVLSCPGCRTINVDIISLSSITDDMTSRGTVLPSSSKTKLNVCSWLRDRKLFTAVRKDTVRHAIRFNYIFHYIFRKCIHI